MGGLGGINGFLTTDYADFTDYGKDFETGVSSQFHAQQTLVRFIRNPSVKSI
jgi:hypothetical protein